ncbi:MAG: hypothetical protein MZU91_08365 [Desulfosudis oleivorans]|nr:hypothetical protein [Desulfosudis oleivorans]
MLLADGCPLPQAGHCDGEAAKTRMGWKELPNESRPTLAHVAYEAGGCWLRDREERLELLD